MRPVGPTRTNFSTKYSATGEHCCFANTVEYAVELSTIAAARYAVYQLAGINNHTVVEQVVAEQHNRMVDDPRQTTYEDSPLPDTAQVRAITDQVAAIMGRIDPRLVPSPFWAHILEPGESTMFHTHSVGHYPGIGLSWVYYASFSVGDGDLIFICQVNEERVFHAVKPAVGRLVIFPTGMPHMTERHAGKDVRVSVSGNYFLPMRTTLDILSGETTSPVSEFCG